MTGDQSNLRYAANPNAAPCSEMCAQHSRSCHSHAVTSRRRDDHAELGAGAGRTFHADCGAGCRGPPQEVPGHCRNAGHDAHGVPHRDREPKGHRTKIAPPPRRNAKTPRPREGPGSPPSTQFPPGATPDRRADAVREGRVCCIGSLHDSRTPGLVTRNAIVCLRAMAG